MGVRACIISSRETSHQRARVGGHSIGTCGSDVLRAIRTNIPLAHRRACPACVCVFCFRVCDCTVLMSSRPRPFFFSQKQSCAARAIKHDAGAMAATRKPWTWFQRAQVPSICSACAVASQGGKRELRSIQNEACVCGHYMYTYFYIYIT